MRAIEMVNRSAEAGEVTSGEAAARTGAGRHVTFEEFYARSAGRLVMQLYLVTGDLEEAQDCVQEACARAWPRWHGLQGTQDGPAGWVYTVAYRIAVSRFRRRMAFLRIGARLAGPQSVAGPAAEVITVRDALSGLPQGQRAALVLHYYEGLPVEAIAEVLGLSASGVKSRLARGRAALGAVLGEGSAR